MQGLGVRNILQDWMIKMAKKQCRITVRKNTHSGIYEINKCGRGIAVAKTKKEAQEKAKDFRKTMKKMKKIVGLKGEY